MIFIDLRDREGLVQVVCDPDRAETFAIAERIRNEYVLRVTGKVRRRPAGTENPDLASGEIEVLAHEIEILNPSVTPPFQLDEEHLNENVRLTHRVIDLRRPAMQKQPHPPPPRRDGGAALLRRARFPRHRDADADASRPRRARATISCPRG